MKNPLFQSGARSVRAGILYRKPKGLQSRKSFALVIVLVFVVLLSAVVLAFLSNAILMRGVSNSSANQTKAAIFAQGALDITVADLKQEIADGSAVYTSNGVPLYFPAVSGLSTKNFSTNLEPNYQGVTPVFSTSLQETDGLNNLLKVSSASPFYKFNAIIPPATTTAVITGVTRASAASTTTASANGRSISLLRWNKPMLLGLKTPTSTTDFTPTASFNAPTWVYVARDGSNPTGWSTGMRTSARALTTVVGRYAYAIYNEGGLLDISAAGFPTGVSSDFSSRRGVLAQVDLAGLINTSLASSLIPDPNSLVKWRNQVTAASATTYTNNILSSTNGFMTVAPGDQTFISRQQLLQYAAAHPTQISPLALQYLGTFSRELNAPSYKPPATLTSPSTTVARPKIQMSSSAYYGMEDAFNPSLINTRVTAAFTNPRMDGTFPVLGEPLIKNRFPLSRLNWLGHNGPNGATAAQIYNAFGLTWSTTIVDPGSPTGSQVMTSGWVYNHGASNRILKLSEVADGSVDTVDGPREPDFFELLQAGIFVGSLGQRGPTFSSSLGGPNLASGDTAAESNVYYSIIQMGANLVDQYDADSWPTRISFDSRAFDGIENLPCLSTIYQANYRFHGINESDGTHVVANDASTEKWPRLGMWYMPAVWNPHADAATYFLSSSYTGPTKLRYTVAGEAEFYAANNGDPVNTGLPSAPNYLTSTAGIVFTNNAAFVQPTVLDPSIGATADYGKDNIKDPGAAGVPGNGGYYLGIYIGEINAPDLTENPSGYLAAHYDYAESYNSPYATHCLQYQDGNGNWVTYNVIRYVHSEYFAWDYQYSGAFVGDWKTFQTTVFRTRISTDPRIDRFGSASVFLNPPGGTPGAPANGATPGFNALTRVWDNDTFRPLPGTTGNPNPMENRIGVYADTIGVAIGWPEPVNHYAYFPGLLSENRNDNIAQQYPAASRQYVLYYPDPDGSIRGADGVYSTGTTANGGFPIATQSTAFPYQGAFTTSTPYGSNNSRPIVLNRPFRSVADMGYASRDMPWKHLDFFSRQSADAALLDLFCLNESPSVVAGKVDLNTRQLPVLGAVIAGAIKSDTDSGSVYSYSEATNAAGILLALESTTSTTVGLVDSTAQPAGPVGQYANKSQLVSRWIPAVDKSLFTLNSYVVPATYSGFVPAASPDTVIKRRREGLVRAMADTANTRTWNLMIDLVAQTGRFAPGATTLDQFTVEGERRVWLHVAIDRYTGKVISQYVEPVYE